jgi:DNA-binding CsgD family transcriptional regulator
MELRTREAAAGKHTVIRAWLPPWVHGLGMPVWVCDPDRNIAYINSRAEHLLGRSPGKCVGKQCYKVVRGKTTRGKSFCSSNCPVTQKLQFNKEIEPFRIRIGSGRRAKWIQVVLIAAQAPNFTGPRLIHCIIDDEKEQRFKRYLTKVMSRTPPARRCKRAMSQFQLTDREKEILALLAEDESLYQVADQLDLSYSTVRNHVQHILNKLGVHSIMEAVAFYLLTSD